MNKYFNNEMNPTKRIKTEDVFDVSCKFEVLAFEDKSEHVPEIDSTYKFDKETTLSI